MRIKPIDKRLVPVLIRAIDSNDRDALPLMAMEALAHLGPLAEPATDSLIATLLSKETGLREEAALCLGHIGLPRPRVLAALASALEQDQLNVQCGVADAIGSFGHAGGSAVPALAQRTKDSASRDARN